MNKRKLTGKTKAKYERVIDEWFINGFNGTAAYRKFYKNIKTDSTATVNFSQIQALPEMVEYIKEKHEAAAKIIDVTLDGVLNELRNWIQADITETISLTEGEIKELPIEIRRLITKYKKRLHKSYDREGNLVNTEDTVELHFVSKERAMEMINKHIGFYEVDNKQKAPQINYDSLSVDVLKTIWDARNGT